MIKCRGFVSTRRRAALALIGLMFILEATPVVGWEGLPNVDMITADNQSVGLMSDLVRDRTSVLHFMYTSCRTACPATTAIVQALQRLLQGEGITFISISADPQQDTPAKLRAWGHQVGVRPGWTLVTGKGRDLRRLEEALQTRLGFRAQHSTQLYVVNPMKKIIRVLDGLEDPQQLADHIRRIAGP